MKMEYGNAEMRYLNNFGLRFNPFPVVPDVDNFFLSRNIDRIITEIIHGIVTRKGFMVLTGEIGLGKTTICRKIMKILEKEGVETSLVFHTAYQGVELLKEINRDFGCEIETLNLGTQIRGLNDFLLSRNEKGKNCAIIIDDAQNLSHKSLELVRMISNLETDQKKLVQILLIGQPELLDKLNSPDLRQLKSRIIIREEASPLSIEGLKNYLLFKLNAAGDQGKTIIKNNAVAKIHKYSEGNFRQVNLLMDRCLYAAFINNTTELSKGIIKEAYFDISPGESPKLRKPLVWCASLLIVFCAALIPYYVKSSFIASDQSLLSPWTSTRPEENINEKKLAITVKKDSEPLASVQNMKRYPILKGPDKQTDKSDAVACFLRAYQLSQYEILFVKALEEHLFFSISESIFNQTGYQLVLLDHVSDDIREAYGVLAYPSKENGGMKYFLFWRPQLCLNEFYYGYQGEEIKVLQRMFKSIDLYDDSLDGNVGKNLLRAVTHFQEQMHLPITGRPDAPTLFLLSHQGEGV